MAFVSIDYLQSSLREQYKKYQIKRKDKKITKTNYFHFGNNSKTNKPCILVKLRTRKCVSDTYVAFGRMAQRISLTLASLTNWQAWDFGGKYGRDEIIELNEVF